MRRSLQGLGASHARCASRRPAGSHRTREVGSWRGSGVLVGQGAFRLPDPGSSLDLEGWRALGRTVLPVGTGVLPSYPVLAGVGVAGGDTLGRAPVHGASLWARLGLAPGLLGQACRQCSRPCSARGLGLGLQDRLAEPGAGLRVRAGAPATGWGPNRASLQALGLGQTPPCAGAAINHSGLGEGAPSSKSTPLREAAGADPPVFGQGLQTGFHSVRTSVRRSSPRPRGCVIAEAREPAGCPAGP